MWAVYKHRHRAQSLPSLSGCRQVKHQPLAAFPVHRLLDLKTCAQRTHQKRKVDVSMRQEEHHTCFMIKKSTYTRLQFCSRFCACL